MYDMKKILILCVIVILSVCSCGKNEETNNSNISETNKETQISQSESGAVNDKNESDENDENIEAKIVSYESVEEMDNDSSFIGKVKRLEGDEESVINKVNGAPTLNFTFTKVEIEEIYKDKSKSLKVGDVITIMENEVYDEDTNTRYHLAGYNMMVPDYEYLLFAKNSTYNDVDYYYSSGVIFGTVSLSDDGRNNNFDESMDEEWFKDFWKQCIDKYVE